MASTGLVGIYFGMFTNDVMEAQEVNMTEKLVQAAIPMSKILERTASEVQDFQKKQHQQFMERIKSTKPEDLTPLDHLRMTLSNLFQQQQKDAESLTQLKAINLQIYEEELREIRSKGAACMVGIEGWSFSDAFYWACVTTMTVGYGDVVPDSTLGKVFTIIYVLFSTALAAKGFRDVVCYPMIVKMKENEAFLLSQFSEGLTARTLKKILKNDLFKQVEKLQYNPEQITKAEFILLVLHSMNKLQMKDILLAAKCFDSLDAHRDGALGQKEQKEQMLLAQQRDRERHQQDIHRREEAARLQQIQSHVGLGSMLRSASDAVAEMVIPSSSSSPSSHGRRRRSGGFYRNLQDEDEEDSKHEGRLRPRPRAAGSVSSQDSTRRSLGPDEMTLLAMQQAIRENMQSIDSSLHQAEEGVLKHLSSNAPPPPPPAAPTPPAAIPPSKEASTTPKKQSPPPAPPVSAPIFFSPSSSVAVNAAGATCSITTSTPSISAEDATRSSAQGESIDPVVDPTSANNTSSTSTSSPSSSLYLDSTGRRRE
eukprot:scaffold90_cov163-Ochromonas_danica.AAC.31